MFVSINSFSQIDTSSHLQISVITCSPGNELYSIFGHTALRVIDSSIGSDAIFNYGTFDFEDPNFLMKFTRGKLDYFLSVENTSQFFAAYQYEGRTITEQVLQLSPQEKRAIELALVKNLTGNNKFYKYDFLFDNCTTRIRDILKTNTNFNCNQQLVKNNTTFRNMLYIYLDSSAMYWSKLGIDILLGSKIDKQVTIEQSTFLPDYLMFAVDSFNHSNHFISERKTYPATSLIQSSKINQPLVLFILLAVLIIFLYYFKNSTTQKTLYYLSITLVTITGLLGCLLLFMWFGTDHKSCGNNYNLLWALPTNLVGLFLIVRKSDYKNLYYNVAILITVILIIAWFWLPQQFNISLLPFTIAMGFCYNFLIKYNRPT